MGFGQLLVWTTTTATTAAGIPGSDLDALAVIGPLVGAFQNRDWVLAVGLLLTVVVYALKRTSILDRVKLGGKWGIRFSVLALAVLTSVALGLTSGQGWFDIVRVAGETAVAAIGGWEFLGKLLRDLTGGSAAPAAPAGEEG